MARKGKPGVCFCGLGGFKVHGHRWRKLSYCETTGVFFLKCLACRCKWKTKRKYAFALDKHREECRSGMTDREILARIESGSLIVCMMGTKVTSEAMSAGMYGRPVVRDLKIFSHTRNGTTYRFVSICAGGKKKKIAIHRLVWMAAHRQLVPAGFDVDHVEGKDVAFPDGIENLKLRESSDNRRAGIIARYERERQNNEDPF